MLTAQNFTFPGFNSSSDNLSFQGLSGFGTKESKKSSVSAWQKGFQDP